MKIKPERFVLGLLVTLLGLAACAPAPASPAGGAGVGVASSRPSVDATTSAEASAPAADSVCNSPAQPTHAMTEGPYFKVGSPERSSLLQTGITGTRLTLSGFVWTTGCKPIAGAELDFWQANENGQYDNSGYTLRGHQFTDSTGRYRLITIIPGLYPGRTEHIHVKVQAPGGPILTSQLFFPGVANNKTDSIFDPALVISMTVSGSEASATYNFVVEAP